MPAAYVRPSGWSRPRVSGMQMVSGGWCVESSATCRVARLLVPRYCSSSVRASPKLELPSRKVMASTSPW